MAYTYTIVDKAGYLLFVFKGAAAVLEDLKVYAADFILNARMRNSTRILLDERDLTFAVDAHDTIQFGEYLAGMNTQSMGLRMAVVCAPHNSMTSRAIETSLQNRSINYRTFEDFTVAEEWLAS